MSGMKELVKRVAAEMQAPAARVRLVRQTAAMLAELEAHCEMAAAVIHDAVAALAERSPEGEPDAALARRLAYLQAACFKVADALAIVQAEAPGCSTSTPPRLPSSSGDWASPLWSRQGDSSELPTLRAVRRAGLPARARGGSRPATCRASRPAPSSSRFASRERPAASQRSRPSKQPLVGRPS